MKIHYGHLKTNLVADTDSYKHGHAPLVKPGLSSLTEYQEARVGGKYNYLAWTGLQPLLAREIMPGFDKFDIQEAIQISADTHNGVVALDVAAWEHTLNKYGGHLPMTIKAMPEGTILEKGNALFTMKSQDATFSRIMGSLEPILMHTWYPSSVLTRDATIKAKLYPLFVKTGCVEALQYAVHDFGLRGTSCLQHGEIGGMAHLIAFNGSDNLRASRGIKAYYGTDSFPAKSVYATEHSVALSFGPGAGELAYINHVLDTVPDGMIASIVIDTYDAHGFIRNVAGNEKVMERIRGRAGRVVFRPDSGDPLVIPVEILELLGEIYGFTYQAGYKVLRDNIGVLQGDGMNEDSIYDLYNIIVNAGWSCVNLVTGSGGGLLVESLTRDTHRFAIKPSQGVIAGDIINFMKRPVTDMTKQSKGGDLKVLAMHTNRYQTISSTTTSAGAFAGYVDSLRTIYDNGKFFPESYDVIRERFERHLPLIGRDI